MQSERGCTEVMPPGGDSDVVLIFVTQCIGFWSIEADFEFTVQAGELFLLQTRRAKRTDWASPTIAVDMVEEELLTPVDALAAIPRFMTLSVFIEEGLDILVLRRVADALAQPASACGVSVVAGDTKVVGRGECDGIYLSTTGIGFKSSDQRFALDRVKVGDQILVSGPVGDHGAAVMLARKEFGFRGDLKPDAASVLDQARALIGVVGLRFMRDPTRGGWATVAHEIARATGFAVQLIEAEIPINDAVHSVCELLGFDPLYMACEGRIVAVVAPEACESALSALRRVAPAGARIGDIRPDGPQVVLETSFGGLRSLDELEDDPLPRIC